LGFEIDVRIDSKLANYEIGDVRGSGR
jgi:hypothetical protein